MHPARFLLPLLLCLPALPEAPEFHASEDAFLKVVGEGQMDPQLDLHRIQYAPDPRWTLEWMTRRGAGSGLYGAWGSVTARRLYTDMGLAMNLDLGRGFSMRYDRREYADGGIDLRQERLGFWWQARPALALSLSGWPAPMKEQGSAGMGFRLASPRSGLEVQILDEGFFWNQKSEGTLRYRRHPLRLLVDGHAAAGGWVMAGSLDLGWRYRLEDSDRSLEGYQRFGFLLVEHRAEGRALGGSLTHTARISDQSTASDGRLHLDREFLRLSTHGRWETRGLVWHAQVAAVRQRDTLGAPRNGPGTYRMDALVLALEAGWRPGEVLELRPGYMASPYRMERRTEPRTEASPLGLLSPGEAQGYTDKVHLRALWTLRPGASIEALISHTLSGSRFGGASVKACLLF